MVENLLHIVDVHGRPGPAGAEDGEYLVRDLLLAELIAGCVTSFDHGRELATERDYRPFGPGDVIVVELVSAANRGLVLSPGRSASLR
ncbi:MAG: hypothetical protein ACRDOU_07335 [Streptosporangiaceae bacterium]